MTDERKPTPDETMGIEWWNGLTELERARWMQVAGNTGVAAEAWAAFKEDCTKAAQECQDNRNQ
jgi:hypothetical protein